jgi:hypothetical protein
MYTIALYSFCRELEDCCSGRGDPQKMGNCNDTEAKEEIVMVQLHKPPSVSYD